MKLKRTLKTLVVATVGGAAAAYLLDPATGRLRRERLVRRVEQRSADVRDLVSKAGRAKDAVVSDEPASSDPPEAAGSAEPAGEAPPVASDAAAGSDATPERGGSPA